MLMTFPGATGATAHVPRCHQPNAVFGLRAVPLFASVVPKQSMLRHILSTVLLLARPMLVLTLVACVCWLSAQPPILSDSRTSVSRLFLAIIMLRTRNLYRGGTLYANILIYATFLQSRIR